MQPTGLVFACTEAGLMAAGLLWQVAKPPRVQHRGCPAGCSRGVCVSRFDCGAMSGPRFCCMPLHGPLAFKTTWLFCWCSTATLGAEPSYVRYLDIAWCAKFPLNCF